MSYYTRKEIDELHPDISVLAKGVAAGGEEDRVISTIEHCLHNGYDRRRIAEKLEKVLDAKQSSKLADKLQDKLDEYRRKAKKRNAIDETGTEMPKKSRFDMKEKSSKPTSATNLTPLAAASAAAENINAVVSP